MPQPDFAGVDLFGIDLAQPVGGNDLAMPGGGTGPGPLGALPAGYCCTKNEDCRVRICMNGYCTDECRVAADCMLYSSKMDCAGNGFCQSTAGFTCLDPSGFHYGTAATGRCCNPGPPSANYCEGGLCNSTGASQNPFYCTQGCLTSNDCPIGYLCSANFCWIAGSLNDPVNYTYTCMP